MYNPWLINKPMGARRNEKQIEFLLKCDTPEILYGGAAGGGKSEALLMGALQFVEVPSYAAILFRKTYADLALPGALMDRSKELLANTGARWNGQDKVWTFPSGATITFGYLDNENDRYRYQSSEFQYVGFDELTQFKERDYTYLFSRLRRTVDNQIPLRMRAGSNPGGVGHLWVKRRFLRSQSPTREFISARIEDNPYIDIPTYEESLQQLDSQTRKQLRWGDWTDFGGNHYNPSYWPRYQDVGDAYRVRQGDRYRHIRKADCTRIVTLDWAMGKPKKTGEQPVEYDTGTQGLQGDCTAFVAADLVDDSEGDIFVLDSVNERIPMGQNAPRLAEFCRRWQPIVVAADDDNMTEAMGLECRRFRDIPTIKYVGIKSRNKLTRAQASIVRAERGGFYLPEYTQEWVEDFSDQLSSFKGINSSGQVADEVDDVVDCVSILGRLADEFRPGEDADDYIPVVTEGHAGAYDEPVWGH